MRKNSEKDAVDTIVAQWGLERPGLDASPMLVLGRIGRIAAIVDGRLRPPFEEAGLGNGDFDVLAALRRTGKPYALTPGQLKSAMLVTTGAVTKRVDRLEARGLVGRAVSEQDARSRSITLTRAGVKLVDRLIAVHVENERRLLAGLTEREQIQLGRLLGRLAVTLEQDSTDQPPGRGT